MSLIMRKVCNYKSIHYTAHEMSIVKVTKLFLQRPVWLKNFSSDLDWWIVLFGKYLILKESKYPKCFIELDMKIRFLTFELSSKNQPSSIHSCFIKPLSLLHLGLKICCSPLKMIYKNFWEKKNIFSLLF